MPATQPFTHLHVHSHYSLLDGAITVPDLVQQAVGHDMGALALTDHGNLFGALEFYKAARKAGINPIVGCEAYLVRGDAQKIPGPGEKRARYHITLLARSRKGYENLCKLSSKSWVHGFHRKPCMDKSMLAEHAEGLIALTGCMSGEVSRALIDKRLDEAVGTAEEYASIFGRENVYLEVMSNGLEPQRVIREAMPAVAQRTGLKLVATNDIHYRCEGDSVAQDALICIGTGQRMHDPNRRFRIETNELYFRSSEQMAVLFGEDSEAYRSTAEIAERCDIQLELDKLHLPRFPIASGEPAPDYLRRLCEDGLRRKYGEITPEVRDRFEKEFAVISSMGFVDYFLIVWDLIRHAREQGIPVGPGRGSAAGSIVAYSLDITKLCPLKYDLLFERFLNADRISMPDIDIDFCRDRREEVIAYTRNKYGESQVCQIVTFGTMAAKAAIRDAGRVLEVPLGEVDKIAKRIPDLPKTRLKDALEADKELADLIAADPKLSELVDLSLRIEGMARNTSTHAAGVVITDRPLMEHVPLCLVQGAVNTQFQMTDLDQIGLLKMDFLGLKNLTILQKAKVLLKKTRDIDLDYDALPLDDPKTYDLLKRGDTAGVFQLESSGMRELIVRLQPDCFEDVIALIALYRPGPLQSGMADSYVNRKHGIEPVKFEHPTMNDILGSTYGCMIYQEQVMLLAQQLGGLSLNDADALRKAMGKKKIEVMAPFREKFLVGCRDNGASSSAGEKIWEDMCQFAQYGFNKSHSAAYGIITYQTAYMKANYPGEYMAAIMSCDAGDSDKLAEYVEGVMRKGRRVLGPDVNSSLDDFSLEGDDIRIGLNAVKGVGGRAVAALLDGREKSGGRFASLGDVLDHVDCKAMNRATFDALTKAGVFDSLRDNRNALVASSERLLREALRGQADRAVGQNSLFGGAAAAAVDVRLDEVAPPTPREIWTMEKDALGFAITVDPLAEHRPLLRLVATHEFGELGDVPERTEVFVGGMVQSLRTTVSQKGRYAGQPMGMFRLQGLGGSCNAIMFARAFARFRDMLVDDHIALFRARVDASREEPTLLVEEAYELSDAAAIARNRRLLLDVPGGEDDPLDESLARLREGMARFPGPTDVYLSVRSDPTHCAVWRLGDEGRVGVCAGLVGTLEELLGPERVALR
ncbi:MAG: DNA polymerase III subunit alpha [Planctomycetes bacterium]|nr:DNA polymerase III subunit alpha [Planctomycetota bacterium]